MLLLRLELDRRARVLVIPAVVCHGHASAMLKLGAAAGAVGASGNAAGESTTTGAAANAAADAAADTDAVVAAYAAAGATAVTGADAARVDIGGIQRSVCSAAENRQLRGAHLGNTRDSSKNYSRHPASPQPRALPYIV